MSSGCCSSPSQEAEGTGNGGFSISGGPGGSSGGCFGEVCAAEPEQERWDGHRGMIWEGLKVPPGCATLSLKPLLGIAPGVLSPFLFSPKQTPHTLSPASLPSFG